MQRALVLLTGALVIALANWTVYQRERQLAHGRIVLLELAPVDPRSLMQGDYMALRFKVADDAFSSLPRAQSAEGRLVVRLDARGVGQFVRRHAGEALGAGEIALRYRIREQQLKFATNAFFFQEGTAERYAAARYGEFRVSDTGDPLLTHLRDEKLQRLGAQRR